LASDTSPYDGDRFVAFNSVASTCKYYRERPSPTVKAGETVYFGTLMN
jgi:hypothetical protein